MDKIPSAILAFVLSMIIFFICMTTIINYTHKKETAPPLTQAELTKQAEDIKQLELEEAKEKAAKEQTEKDRHKIISGIISDISYVKIAENIVLTVLTFSDGKTIALRNAETEIFQKNKFTEIKYEVSYYNFFEGIN